LDACFFRGAHESELAVAQRGCGAADEREHCVDSLQRFDEGGVGGVVDFAHADTAGCPGWLRSAGEDYEGVGIVLVVGG